METLNPVTFRGISKRGSNEKINISMSRMGTNKTEISDGQNRTGQEIQNYTIFVLWKGSDESPEFIGQMMIEEEKFLKGFKLLYPQFAD